LAREDVNATSARVTQQKYAETAGKADLEEATKNSAALGEPPDLHEKDAADTVERAAMDESEQRALKVRQRSTMNMFGSPVAAWKSAPCRGERFTRPAAAGYGR
jgi:hypothetical protein